MVFSVLTVFNCRLAGEESGIVESEQCSEFSLFLLLARDLGEYLEN
jgi:hypothetical protein